MSSIQLSSSISQKHKYLHQWAYPFLLIAAWATLATQTVQYNKPISLLYSSAWVLAAAFLIHKRSKKLCSLSYDAENLCLQLPNQEEIIPLWQIREVRLVSLNGGYRISFNRHYSSRDEVLFLPSFWYPLNYKKMDKKVEAFRAQIIRTKLQQPQKSTEMQLPS